MPSIDAESTALVSAAVVPSVTDPLGGVVFFAGLAMGAVMFIASRTFRPRPPRPITVELADPGTAPMATPRPARQPRQGAAPARAKDRLAA